MNKRIILLGLAIGAAVFANAQGGGSTSNKRKKLSDWLRQRFPRLAADYLPLMSDAEVDLLSKWAFDYYAKNLSVPKDQPIYQQLYALFSKYNLNIPFLLR